MRTKLIIVIVVLVAAVVAAFTWREYRKACCVEPPPEEIAPIEIVDDVDPEPVFERDVPLTIEGSPEGLYKDLDDAFQRAGERPDIELDTLEAPTPPTREDG